MMKAQCSCRECRYITGGGSNYFIAMPKTGFKYTQGEVSSFTRDDLDSPVTREFCPNCGTRIWAQLDELGIASVNGLTLDERDHFQPTANHCTDNAPNWCQIDQSLDLLAPIPKE